MWVIRSWFEGIARKKRVICKKKLVFCVCFSPFSCPRANSSRSTFVMDDLSKLLTVALLSWATWADHSQLLFCKKTNRSELLMWLFKNERFARQIRIFVGFRQFSPISCQEQIPPVALYSFTLLRSDLVIHSCCSLQNANREWFAQVPHDKRATEAIRSFSWANCSFFSFAHKKWANHSKNRWANSQPCS